MPRTWTNCSSRKTATGARSPAGLGVPERTLRQKDFMRVLEACVENCRASKAGSSSMREWLELDTDEICKELAISPTNLWIMLHRARLRLRDCLANWLV